MKRDRRKRSIKVLNSSSILSLTEATEFRSHKEIQIQLPLIYFSPLREVVFLMAHIVHSIKISRSKAFARRNLISCLHTLWSNRS